MRAPWLKLIGPPAWFHAGGELRFAAERPFQLMALLAYHGDWMPRERLATLFWPSHGADAARRNLRKVLYRLRELPACPEPEEHGAALRWAVPTDLQALDSALAAGDLAAVAGAWPLQPFDGLDGDAAAFGEWLAFERQRLRTRWRQALLGGIDRAEVSAAVSWAQALRDADPLDEAALQALLRALVRADRGSDARAEYQRFEQAMAQELAARPSAQTRALAQGLMPGAPKRTPLPRSPEPGDAAWPGLVGRQAERRDVLAWAATPERRWLSLVGPGGIGKTRLVQALMPDLPDAVYVPLQDLPDPAALPQRLAQALQLGPSAATWPGLQSALATRRSLLVLDNLEPLLAAVPELDALLAAAPGLRVLATSRERCSAQGERVQLLAGLPCPDPEDSARAEEFDAVQLFVQAARRQQPDFSVEAERAALVALCSEVEGWPLALELAAAWTRHLRVADILAELRAGRAEVLAVVDGRGGGHALRHASVEATLAPTFDRLAEVERLALMRLALFDAPFGADAARAVAAAPLPLLVSLVDKSLLRQEAAQGAAPGGPRWSMHALVRRHALARLSTRPALQAQAQDALAALLSHRAQSCPPRRNGPAHQRALDELLPELPALQQAWRTSLQAGRADRLAALQRVLSRLMMARNEWSAAQALLAPALPLLAGQALAQLQATLAHVQFYGGAPLPAIELARTALRTLRRGGDAESVMACLWILGLGATRSGRQAAARRCLEEGLGVARGLGDSDSEVSFLDGLSGVAYALGRHDEQVAWLERGIALSLQHGGRPMVSLSNLGNALRAQQRHDEALAAFERGLALAAGQPERYRRERATLLCNKGLLLAALQRLDEAQACAHEGLAAAADGVDPLMALHLMGLLAGLERERGDPAGASARLRQALAGARRLGLLHAQLWLLLDWVRCLQAAGRTEEAVRVLSAVASNPAVQRNELPKIAEIRAALRVDDSPDLLRAERQGQGLAAPTLIDQIVAHG